MKKNYRLPFRGTLLGRKPLAGKPSDPIRVVDLKELPDFPTHYDENLQRQVSDHFSFTCLDYNIDEGWCEIELEASEEFHEWLANQVEALEKMRKVALVLKGLGSEK